MLPFLKRNLAGAAAGNVMHIDRPGTDELEHDDKQQPQDDGLHECAKALIEAVHKQDEKGVSKALEDAFSILESRPHDEGDHLFDREDK